MNVSELGHWKAVSEEGQPAAPVSGFLVLLSDGRVALHVDCLT